MGQVNLKLLAKQVMQKKGLLPELSKEAKMQLATLKEPAHFSRKHLDLRALLWCSIDYDETRDLDQLTYGEYEDGKIIIWVAIADVDSIVNQNTPIDDYAKANTTSVYTPKIIFPMLPEKISNDLTSLLENEDRLVLAIKMEIDEEGIVKESSIFHAIVRNYAKLTYHEVGMWLDGKEQIPKKVEEISGLENVLRCQYEASLRLKKHRYQMGAMSLEPQGTRVKILPNEKVVVKYLVRSPAYLMIEHFMIAANFVIATHLKKNNVLYLCRIVRKPKRWDRIVEIAKNLGKTLDSNPNPKDLEDFLNESKNKEPESFYNLSLVIQKLLGKGEYSVGSPNHTPLGHFGLALKEYTHFTVPSRRFADLVTQRLLKAYLYQKASPYTEEELEWLAQHCTKMEDAAMKVERHLNKSAAALILSDQIGQVFPGIVTGAAEKGTWVKIFQPHIEGKVIEGSFQSWDVGDPVQVKLISVDVNQGFINFSSVE